MKTTIRWVLAVDVEHPDDMPLVDVMARIDYRFTSDDPQIRVGEQETLSQWRLDPDPCERSVPIGEDP